MKEKLIDEIKTAMRTVITADQMSILCNVLNRTLQNIVIAEKLPDSEARVKANSQLQTLFISAKRVEGCSEKTLKYYASTIEYMLRQIDKNIVDITTTDLRCYLASYQSNNQSSKVTIDNIRRIFSSFFAWLEDEDYILKSPVRRIHKVKTGSLIKEVLSDENLEILRDNCTHIRDLAIVDMLSSTGIRVGELVKINREDIDFHERECVVFGKGNKEREVYFNARTKIHLKQYRDAVAHAPLIPFFRLMFLIVQHRNDTLGHLYILTGEYLLFEQVVQQLEFLHRHFIPSAHGRFAYAAS